VPDVVMPRLSDSMEEGTILKWLKATGDEVRRGEELVEIETDKATIVYEAEADGFLRKMVRSMVGGLIAAGRGVVRPEALARALEARDRGAWPAPAPACGLTLVRVVYPVLG